ncbi:MAG: hypothetical protein AAGA90_06850 [Actinomycetota bacterium]
MAVEATMRRRLWCSVLLGFALVAAGCGGSDDDEGDDAVVDLDGGATDDTTGATDDAGDDQAGDDQASDDEQAGDVETPPADDADAPDDDDAAEITGNPDLDLEDLPDDAAGLLDEIDDLVSIGDCRSEVLGIGFTAPDGWQCRVLDVSLGGIDGFTLFTDGNELNITVGTPSPIQACEVLQACDAAVAIDLGPQWPGGQQFELAGTTTIWASHASVPAEVVITKLSALTDDELDFVRAVLDTTTEVS